LKPFLSTDTATRRSAKTRRFANYHPLQWCGSDITYYEVAIEKDLIMNTKRTIEEMAALISQRH
jgi:hypothetical protein